MNYRLSLGGFTFSNPQKKARFFKRTETEIITKEVRVKMKKY
jgi:hypothetical protein